MTEVTSGRGAGGPPGWPSAVLPPDAPGWVESAASWLFDLCPPDYRRYEVLRRHPVVLARCTQWHVAGAREAAQRGLRSVRADLRDVVGPEVVDAAADVFERETARLAQAARELTLVEQAIRGHRPRPRL